MHLRRLTTSPVIGLDGIKLADHVTLSPSGNLHEYISRFNPLEIVRDLRSGVFGPSGYFADLCALLNLQQQFLDCYNEMENYTINV